MVNGMRLLLAATATLTLAACGSAESDAKSAKKPAAAARDWTATVVATPEGGYRMGSPDAPVKLIEYASFTCTHCRDFHIESAAALKGSYVKSGKVSYEYRPFLLNGVDMVAALTAKCAPATQFFVWADQLYRNHDAWVLPFTKIDKPTIDRVQKLPQTQQLIAYAGAGQFDGFARLRGLPKAKYEQCLADPAGAQRLQATAQAGQDQYQITGTPTFILNGEKVADALNWATLEPKIKALL